jgi:hypothetical protein
MENEASGFSGMEDHLRCLGDEIYDALCVTI